MPWQPQTEQRDDSRRIPVKPYRTYTWTFHFDEIPQHCDASDRAIGSVLLQGEGESTVTIAYYSEKLSPTDRKYSSTERECLAEISTIDKFRPASALETADPWYAEMLKKVTENPYLYPKFKLLNKLLKLCKMKDDLQQATEQWRIIVPQDHVEEVLKEHHDLPISGHLGIPKATARIKTFYYWQRMDNDIKRYVSNCEVCKTSKDLNYNTTTPMTNQLVV